MQILTSRQHRLMKLLLHYLFIELSFPSPLWWKSVAIQVLLHNHFSTAESVKAICEFIDLSFGFIQQSFAHVRLLLDGLLVPIKPLLKRLKYPIHIRNPLLDDMKQERERIFSLTQQAMQQTAQTSALSPVADDEMGYLGLHSQGALERQVSHKVSTSSGFKANCIPGSRR